MKYDLKISRTAHYFVQTPDKKPKSVLIALHGYAQLAENFLNDFSDLKSTDMIVIAPEGISKFYNKEKQAVASWMTSHEREDEIHDYINYLNELIEHIKPRYENLPITVLGFSQGVSTLMRWLINCPVQIDQAFLCCGTIPPEIEIKTIRFNHTTKINYYYGLSDRLLSVEKAVEQINTLRNLKFETNSKSFEGRHEIHSLILTDLIKHSKSIQD